ncbi:MULTISPECIES: hypothetical protein [Yersinia]|uniref:hypothetical protein n=1 Tax=Yersinia TaxID=629 RepID=UPI0005DB0574|nr:MULTISPECIES: hypothetical protein [Yersinia]MCB5318647.1 hypothetical protein [Yersinia massiliensis]CQH41780.1 Uncharacterised protein [Yersinia frederiksenii]
MNTEILSHIGNTIFGHYQNDFCPQWDEILNRILDSGELVECRGGVISFKFEGKEIDIWANNKWYSYGNVWRIDGVLIEQPLQKRPRFKTMQRLNNLHTELRLKESKAKYQGLIRGI